VVGTAAAVFHLAAGLWRVSVTWGLAVTEEARRRTAYACAAFGTALAVLGLATITHFATGASPLLSAPEVTGGDPVREVLTAPCPPAASGPSVSP